jgi:hypothetical protein
MDPADVALALTDDVNKRFPVEAQRYCPSHIHVVERRRVAVDDQVAADAARHHLANRLGRLPLDQEEIRLTTCSF